MSNHDTYTDAAPLKVTASAHQAAGLQRTIRRLQMLMLGQGSFLISVVFHLLLVLIGFSTLRVVQAVSEAIVEEQVVIPDTNLVDAADVTQIPNPGLNDDPTRRAMQDQDPSVKDSNQWADKRSQTITQSSMSGADSQSATVIGLGASASSAGPAGLDNRGGAGGPGLAAFGPPGGGSRVFAPPGGNVTKVVYVCDASGSMLGERQALLMAELQKAISPLRPVQFFNVVFFGSNQAEPQTFNRKDLMAANADNKQRAYAFLQTVRVAGSTDPIPALQAAFAMRPQLIYLLSDGFEAYGEPQKLIDEINRLNRDKKTFVKTIMFRGSDDEIKNPNVKRLYDLMDQIAKDNGGGRVRYVSVESLMR